VVESPWFSCLPVVVSFRKHRCSQRSLSSSLCSAPLRHGSVGARSGPAALKRLSKSRSHLDKIDKTVRPRRLTNEIAADHEDFAKILNPISRVAASHRQRAMKTISHNPEAFESTYALLVRSEEKQRSRFEMLVYTLLIVSTLFAVAQFGHQAAMMPPSIAHVATAVSASPQHGG